MKLCLTAGDLRAAKRAGKIGVIMEHFLIAHPFRKTVDLLWVVAPAVY
jgi:hypothetical protein